jgi:MFS family permease
MGQFCRRVMRTKLPLFRNHSVAALVVICLSAFVVSVDATIVNVALPTLSRELDADTAQLQWIVDAYTLVMSGLLLSAGIGDVRGAVNHAFLDGMQAGSLVCAGIAFAAAGVVAVLLRSRARQSTPAQAEPEPAGAQA